MQILISRLKHDFILIRKELTLIKSICILKLGLYKKVQVGKDQEKAQSEKDSHSKNRDGKKLN